MKSRFIDLSFPSGHLLLLIESASCFWQGGFFFFCGASTAFGKVYCFLKGCNFALNSRGKKKKLPQGRLLCPLQPVCSCSHNSLQATASEFACMWWRRCCPIRIIFSYRNVELVTLLLMNALDHFSGLFS